MVDRSTSRPISGSLPKAGLGYDQQQMNLLIREIEDRFALIDGFRFLKGSGMLLVNLQGNGSGLRVNEVYEEDGFLKIVKSNDVFAPSLLLQMSVGNVDVVIT